jgi:glycogen operon protein
MGDEVRRTQQGSNNAYCQDSEMNWFDWSLLHKHADVHRFVKQLIAARLARSQSRTDEETLLDILQTAEVQFHGVYLGQPDEGDSSHSLAVTFQSTTDTHFHMMINAYWEPLTFQLPPLEGQAWRVWLDTARPSPQDICPWEEATAVAEAVYEVASRSVVILLT